jgi:hypothetical protein
MRIFICPSGWFNLSAGLGIARSEAALGGGKLAVYMESWLASPETGSSPTSLENVGKKGVGVSVPWALDGLSEKQAVRANVSKGRRSRSLCSFILFRDAIFKPT